MFQKTDVFVGATVGTFMVKEIEVMFCRLSLRGAWKVSTHFFKVLSVARLFLDYLLIPPIHVF
jgi:hypothetical protein